MLFSRSLASDALIYAQRIIKGLQGVADAENLLKLSTELSRIAQDDPNEFFCARIKLALKSLLGVWDERFIIENWKETIVTHRGFFSISVVRINAPVRRLALEELISACGC